MLRELPEGLESRVIFFVRFQGQNSVAVLYLTPGLQHCCEDEAWGREPAAV